MRIELLQETSSQRDEWIKFTKTNFIDVLIFEKCNI